MYGKSFDMLEKGEHIVTKHGLMILVALSLAAFGCGGDDGGDDPVGGMGGDTAMGGMGGDTAMGGTGGDTAEGPNCPEDGDKCVAACEWLTDCALDSGECPGYEGLEGEERTETATALNSGCLEAHVQRHLRSRPSFVNTTPVDPHCLSRRWKTPRCVKPAS